MKHYRVLGCRLPGEKCELCGKELIATSARYLVCTTGHGKLIPRLDFSEREEQADKKEFKERMDRCL